ncbi:MAG: hypothetical protein MK008_03690 [Bdellovibrionales bacterium]|nr:hypothetical protein [Bdellovibrionales bacterium]
MKFSEQSYSGKVLRPNPVVEITESAELILVLTCWGNSDASDVCINTIRDYFFSTMDDQDATSPHPIYPQYSAVSNHLRIAVQLANESIYTQFNHEQFNTGIEIFAASLNQMELSWVSLGFPQVFISQNSAWKALDLKQDLSFDYGFTDQKLPPLPSQFLGQHNLQPLQPKSIRINESDKLLLCSHNQPQLPQSDELGAIVKQIASSSSSDAFWTGLLEL